MDIKQLSKSKILTLYAFISIWVLTRLSGQSWEVLYTHPGAHFQDIFFINDTVGWVVGTNGLVLHTTDGGYSWHNHDIGFEGWLSSVHFIDIQKGWIAGSNGKVFQTVDAGTTWVEQETGISHYISDLVFSDDYSGWGVGASGTNNGFILRTVNGGNTWEVVGEGLAGAYLGVDFVNNGEGWVVGGYSLFDNYENPIIWYTSDYGETWVEQYSSLSYGPIVQVEFLNSEEGWAVGMHYQVIHTSDGGENWEPVDVMGDTVTNCCYLDVTATDSENIWLNHYNYIYHSRNGGLSWDIEWEWNGAISVLSFPRLSFIDSNHGWAIGDSIVLGYSETAVSISQNNYKEIPVEFSLMESYPNPFNPVTTIRFDLPKAGNVELVIYDILGREVMTLVNSRHVAGQHKVVWNASDVASGVYFYRLVVRQDGPETSGSYTETKKLIVLK